jgi:NADH:ubiquinone oxidoreductase subunit 3 (subunit A)
METGATYHITRQLNKLTIHENYKGHDRIHDASGKGMHMFAIQYYTPLLALLTFEIVCMFLVLSKVYFMHIKFPLTTMHLLSFTCSFFLDIGSGPEANHI